MRIDTEQLILKPLFQGEGPLHLVGSHCVENLAEQEAEDDEDEDSEMDEDKTDGEEKGKTDGEEKDK